MDTVREGLRAGDIRRGRFERLTCSTCERELGLQDDAEAVGTVMACPDCESAWLDL